MPDPSTTSAHRRRATTLCVAACVALALGDVVSSQNPAMELETVDLATAITDKRGSMVPGDLGFTDEMRRSVTLGDYFGKDRPVILNLGYYGCPSLCGAVTNALVDAMTGVGLDIGSDFEVVTLSIDPAEKPALAREKKNAYLSRFTAPAAEEHWHFLTGDEKPIAALADTVGFGYQWNEAGKQWDHSAGVMILSPDGKLSQVLQGAYYSPRTLRLALVEASEGKVGTTWDRILLTCYGYDPTTGEYSLMVWTVVRIGGVLTVLGIATMIIVLLRRERRLATATEATTPAANTL
jgi:protein SCO1/2